MTPINRAIRNVRRWITRNDNRCRHAEGCSADATDHVVCDQHRDLPNSTQKFWRRKPKTTSTKETK